MRGKDLNFLRITRFDLTIQNWQLLYVMLCYVHYLIPVPRKEQNLATSKEKFVWFLYNVKICFNVNIKNRNSKVPWARSLHFSPLPLLTWGFLCLVQAIKFQKMKSFYSIIAKETYFENVLLWRFLPTYFYHLDVKKLITYLIREKNFNSWKSKSNWFIRTFVRMILKKKKN